MTADNPVPEVTETSPSGVTCVSRRPREVVMHSQKPGEEARARGPCLVPESTSPRGCVVAVSGHSRSHRDSSGLGDARMEDTLPVAPARSRRAEEPAPPAPHLADGKTEALTIPTAVRGAEKTSGSLRTSESVFSLCWAAGRRREHTVTSLCGLGPCKPQDPGRVHGGDTHPQRGLSTLAQLSTMSHVL